MKPQFLCAWDFDTTDSTFNEAFVFPDVAWV